MDKEPDDKLPQRRQYEPRHPDDIGCRFCDLHDDDDHHHDDIRIRQQFSQGDVEDHATAISQGQDRGQQGASGTVACRGMSWRGPILVFLLWLFGVGAAPAQTEIPDELVRELGDAGYTRIEVGRTLLGRIRILAHGEEKRREIVLSPSNGLILRDYVYRSPDAKSKPAVDKGGRKEYSRPHGPAPDGRGPGGPPPDGPRGSGPGGGPPGDSMR